MSQRETSSRFFRIVSRDCALLFHIKENKKYGVYSRCRKDRELKNKEAPTIKLRTGTGTTMMLPAATLSLLVLVLVTHSHGFSLPSTRIGGQRSSTERFSIQDDSNDVMKSEIEEMRNEARRRIEALTTQISGTNSASASVDVLDQLEKTAAFEPVASVSNKPVASETERPSYNSKSMARVKKQEVASLLDDTRWKIMLNIGREPGKSSRFTLSPLSH